MLRGAGKGGSGLNGEELVDALEIIGRIDAERFVFSRDNTDAVAIFKGAQLLQVLGPFERPDGQVGIVKQEVAAIDV